MTVRVQVARLGSKEIPALINTNEVWLPVKDLFDFLQIPSQQSARLDSVWGRFDTETYSVSTATRQLLYQHKKTVLTAQDLVPTESNLYLRLGLFGEVFGLEGQFNFRTLSVRIRSKVELPAVREMQREQMRKNLLALRGQKKADTVLPRNFSFFQAGVAAWSVSSILQSGNKTRWCGNLAFGGQFAGGEVEVNLNYNSDHSLVRGQQYWRWRRVIDNFAPVRQVAAGRIYVPALSSLNAPVTGVQVSNCAVAQNKSFGSYKLVSKTEPDWTVELYINNVLVDYVKADASGVFSFDVPLVYGSSIVTMRFFGPAGEEESREENISIPYNFLPGHQFEYTVSAGEVNDALRRRLYRGQGNLGITNRLTIGAGAEWISHARLTKPVIFANASMRIASGILVSTEYAEGLGVKANLNYRFPFQLQVDLAYAQYQKDQKLVRYDNTEGLKASFTYPFRLKNYPALTRLRFNQYNMVDPAKTPRTNHYEVEHVLSASAKKLNGVITSRLRFDDAGLAVFNSGASVSLRLKDGTRITPQFQFDFTKNRFLFTKLEASRQFSGGAYLNVSYDRSFDSPVSIFNLGLRLNLAFAQTYTTANRRGAVTTISQTASGSMIYDRRSELALARNKPSLGKGGMTLEPFLDINGNQKREAGEPRVPGLKFKIRGGHVISNPQHSLIRIVDLEPYISYIVELDATSFGNISWQMKHKTLAVTVEPNQVKMVEIPVSVVGEASGMVYLQQNEQRGIGRIKVCFYDSTGHPVAQTLSEADGYFSYLGLPAGHYMAGIDTAQLAQIGFSATPQKINFQIAGGEDGVIADGFAFVLTPLPGSQPGHQTPSSKSQANPKPSEEQTKKEVVDSAAVVMAAPKQIAAESPTVRTGLKSEAKRTNAVRRPAVKHAAKRTAAAGTKTGSGSVHAANLQPGKKITEEQIERVRDGLQWYFQPVKKFIIESKQIAGQWQDPKRKKKK